MRARPTSLAWTKAPLALTLSALLLGGLLLYEHASGQREKGNGATPSHTHEASRLVPSLTEEELAWLREHPVIRVAQDPGWPPVEFDNEKGEPSGISIDYLNLIEQRLGVKFERIRGLTWQESYARLKRWDIDMTTCVAVTQERSKFWEFTEPYLHIPIVILTRADVTYVGNMRELNGARVAVVTGYVSKEWIQRDFPEIELISVNSVKEGMELLQRGDVFAFVDNMLVIGYYLAKLKMVDLKIAGPTPYINAQSMAVRKDWAILAHILDKALDSITDEERAGIYQKWVPIRYEHGMDYKLLWQVLALAGLIVGGLLLWNRKLSREIRHRQQAEAALGESEKRYRGLWEKAPVMMISLDEQARINFASDRICEELGYGREDLLEKTPFMFQTKESAHYAETVVFPQFLKTGVVKDAPLQLVRKNGQVIDVLLNVTAERDAEGKVVRSRSVFIDVTDRKKAEEALREQEQKYRLLAENTLDVIWQLDLDLRFTYVNQAILRMTGYTPDEWIGTKLSEHCDEENFAKMAQVVAREIAKGLNSSGSIFEAVMRKKDGVPFDVEIHGKVLFDNDGRPIALQGVTRDIAERKRTEEALRTSEAQLANAVEMARLGHWELDVFKNEFTFNDQFYKLFRTTAKQVGGYKMALEEYARRFVYPDDISVVSYENRKAIETDDPHFSRELEHRIMYADGDIGHISVRFFIVKDEQGRTVRTYGVNQDITERRKAAEALRDSEQRLAQIIDFLPDATFVIDLNGKLVAWNKAIEDLTGVRAHEILGKGDFEYALPFYGERRPVLADLVLNRDKLIEAYYDLFREEGDTLVSVTGPKKLNLSGRFLWNRASPLYDSEGRVTGSIESIRDITDSKRLEEQLLQSQKMEAIGTLAGGVAHDFNNILQVALGYSEIMLEDEEFPKGYQADLQKIYDSAKRGADLVQRLLTFSRKTEVSPQALDLNLRINELRKILERTLPKMVEIKIVQDAKLAYINADKTQIDQILMNLAVNARDAMPDGGKLIFETASITLDDECARANLEAKPGPHVLLTVTDTGLGMDKDTLEHIFEPFYTTKGVGQGTGLGLAMVHGIVKQHGGHIRGYSEPGKGTTFNIYFPAMISEEEEAQTIERPMPRGGSETILLVDDEEFIRDLGSRILSKAGYGVITASDGREALEIYQQRSGDIDLVLLDLMMPEMGGKQCLEGLLILSPSVNVVIASGYSASGPTKDALSAGAKAFVNKPYDMRQMLEVVRGVLDSE